MIKKSEALDTLQNSLKILEKVFIDRTLPAHLISEVYTAIHDLKNLELQLMSKEQAHFESIFTALEKEYADHKHFNILPSIDVFKLGTTKTEHIIYKHFSNSPFTNNPNSSTPKTENMIFGSLNPNFLDLSTPDYIDLKSAKILKFEKK